MKSSIHLITIFLLTWNLVSSQSILYSSIHINEPAEIRNKIAELIKETEIRNNMDNTIDTIYYLTELDSTNRCDKSIFLRGEKKTIYKYKRTNNKIVKENIEYFDETDSMINKQKIDFTYDLNDRLIKKVTTSSYGSIIGQTKFEIGDNGFPIRCISDGRIEEAEYDIEKNRVNITIKDSKGRKSYDSDFVLYPKIDFKYPNSKRFYNEKGDIVFEKEDDKKMNYYKYLYDDYGNWVNKEMYSIELFHSPKRYMNELILKSIREIKYKKE